MGLAIAPSVRRMRPHPFGERPSTECNQQVLRIDLVACLHKNLDNRAVPFRVQRCFQAALASLYGALFGLMPTGWIVLNIIFLHRLTEENGSFKVPQDKDSRPDFDHGAETGEGPDEPGLSLFPRGCGVSETRPPSQ
jgi:hypothetical protein